MKNLENITVSRDGSTLTLTVDISKTLRESASGKTLLVATSGGASPVANVDGVPVYANVTLYKYPPREQ